MAYIQVRNLQTGQTGKMPEENFSSGKYERLDVQPETSSLGALESVASFFYPGTTKTLKDIVGQATSGKIPSTFGATFNPTRIAKETTATLPLIQYGLGAISPDLQSESFKTVEPAAREVATTYLFSQLLPWLTKSKIGGGVSRKTASAAEKATQEGVTVPYQKVEQNIRTLAENKLGKTPEVQKTLSELILEKIPGQPNHPTPGGMTPNELLTWRKQIATRGGKSFFQRLFTGTNVSEKTEGYARSAISSLLHEYAPETKLPDALYRMYSGPFGSPPEALWKLLLGGGAYGMGRKIIAGSDGPTNYYSAPSY